MNIINISETSVIDTARAGAGYADRNLSAYSRGTVGSNPMNSGSYAEQMWNVQRDRYYLERDQRSWDQEFHRVYGTNKNTGREPFWDSRKQQWVAGNPQLADLKEGAAAAFDARALAIDLREKGFTEAETQRQVTQLATIRKQKAKQALKLAKSRGGHPEQHSTTKPRPRRLPSGTGKRFARKQHQMRR